ncbi:hypothetical protein AC249_AIPGENE22684 [Exaiptasia diaphana]|nr:hypothetical protein AC249_AIPGENE22684 [Exaiptasia diaphana]
MKTDQDFCKALCYMDDRCLSINYITENQTCELSESDHVISPEHWVARPGSVYYRAENNCSCSGNETCRYNYELNSFQCTANRCKEMVLRSLEGKALNDFVFKKVQTDENFCRSLCYMDDRCLSINYITVKQTCELSESDHVMQPSSFVSRPRSVYYRVENNCRCSSKETCRYNSALNKFQCLCNAKDPTANCNASEQKLLLIEYYQVCRQEGYSSETEPHRPKRSGLHHITSSG